MSQARFSVRAAVAEGFGFWRGNVFKASGPLLVALAGLVVLLFGKTVPLILVGIALYLLAGVIVQGALYRVALPSKAHGEPGWFGLQWGMVETRLALVGLFTLLVLAVCGFAAGVILNLIEIALAGAIAGSTTAPLDETFAALSPRAKAVYGVASLALFLGLFVLNARLSLAAPATTSEGRLRFLGVLGMTRGATARTALASLIALSPVIAGQFLAGWLVETTNSPQALGWTQLVVGIVSTFFYLPILVGMSTHIYQRLREGADQ